MREYELIKNDGYGETVEKGHSEGKVQVERVPFTNVQPVPFTASSFDSGSAAAIKALDDQLRQAVLGSSVKEKPGYVTYVRCHCCGKAQNVPIGDIDPTEYKCTHHFAFNNMRGPRGGLECISCKLFIPRSAEITGLPWDSSRANALADACGTLRDTNRNLLAENATLRRELEALQKKNRHSR